jgi:nucleotide-binding universal stress UspA family protein
MEVNSENTALLAVSADLGRLTDAALIGIAACQPVQPFGEIPYAGDLLDADMLEIRRETRAAEKLFRSFIADKVRQLSFRSANTYQELADYLAGQARAADYVVTGPDLGGSLLDNTRHTNIGDLVMNTGRPVIIVPAHATQCLLSSVVIAWKDRREARRAVADALPLLHHARQIVVVEIARKGDTENAAHRTADVTAWLGRHGVLARPLVRTADSSDVDCLRQFLEEQNCDFLVAGAYSHSRIGEWAFGGITTDLLLNPHRITLVSH